MKKLKLFRLQTGLTQHGLAEIAKMPRWKIQYIECGYLDPTSAELTALATALGIKVEVLAP